MDTLTHALSGVLIARASAPAGAAGGTLRRRVAAGGLAAAAPDLDFVLGLFGPVQYLLTHRGVTHSVLLLPLWAWVLSWALAKLLREPGGWRALYGVVALALAAHIAGDVITSFGTVVFAPFSDWRAAIGTTFIIDLWFSGIILTGLLASLALRRSRAPAVAAGLALVGYVGLQYVQKQQALDIGAAYARDRGLSAVRIDAQPRPVSPFNWTIFVADGATYHYSHVNLLRQRPREHRPDDGFIARLDAAYLPVAQATWHVRTRFGGSDMKAVVEDAWQSPSLSFFRWFADLPAFDGMTDGSTCVWFADLRFLTPGRDTMPFRFGVCRDQPESPWRAYQRREDGSKVAVE